MARVQSGPVSRERRRRRLKLAKGYWGSRSKHFRAATETVNRAMAFSYRDRKVKKRFFRALWITRIGIACRQCGISYSVFMDGLKKSSIDLNRKVLAELAYTDIQAFNNLVEKAKTASAQ